MKKFLWIDIETTGLDPKNGHILEIAAIITDTKLNTIDEMTMLIMAEPMSVIRSMCNDFVLKMHTDNNLLEDLIMDSHMSSYKEASTCLGDFIKKHFKDGEKPEMHGNSVHFDKKWIEWFMPEISNLWNYRIVDVSTFKVICSNYSIFPSIKTEIDNYDSVYKNVKHRALDDIKKSIFEYRLYLSSIFNLKL